MPLKPPPRTSDLRQITTWLRDAGLHSIEISGPDGAVRIVMDDTASMLKVETIAHLDAETPLPERGNVCRVTAEDIGTFLHAHPLRDAPFVRPGDGVKKGDIVALLKSRTIYLPVTSPCDGIVGRMHTEHGQAVDFAAPLLDIETEIPGNRP